jgi:VanZ family protein
LAYGCAIELLQMWTATRHADWHDVIADVVGLWVAAAIRGRFDPRSHRKTADPDQTYG